MVFQMDAARKRLRILPDNGKLHAAQLLGTYNTRRHNGRRNNDQQTACVDQ
jgi:hypothetical protein